MSFPALLEPWEPAAKPAMGVGDLHVPCYVPHHCSGRQGPWSHCLKGKSQYREVKPAPQGCSVRPHRNLAILILDFDLDLRLRSAPAQTSPSLPHEGLFWAPVGTRDHWSPHSLVASCSVHGDVPSDPFPTGCKDPPPSALPAPCPPPSGSGPSACLLLPRSVPPEEGTKASEWGVGELETSQRLCPCLGRQAGSLWFPCLFWRSGLLPEETASGSQAPAPRAEPDRGWPAREHCPPALLGSARPWRWVVWEGASVTSVLAAEPEL